MYHNSFLENRNKYLRHGGNLWMKMDEKFAQEKKNGIQKFVVFWPASLYVNRRIRNDMLRCQLNLMYH